MAVNTGFVTNETPDNRFISFYAERCSSKLYCAIVGNVVVPGGVGTNPNTPRLTPSKAWTDVCSAIGEKGSLPGIQLSTTWPDYVGMRKFVSAHPEKVISEARELVERIGPSGTTTVLNQLTAGTAMAIEHGFKHIQFHAAHGYLLNLLIDHRLNKYADHVLQQLGDLSDQIRNEGAETSLRLSLMSGYQKFDVCETGTFLDRACGTSFSFFDVSSGFYNIDKRLIYPARPEILRLREEQSLSLANRHPDASFIVSGRAYGFNWDAMPANAHIGVCRDLIANPQFLDNPASGCRNLNKCHYFSRGEPYITCGQWKKNGQGTGQN